EAPAGEVERGVERAAAIRLVRDVGVHVGRGRNLRFDRRSRLAIAAGEGDAVAVAREALDAGAADPVRASGNQHHDRLLARVWDPPWRSAAALRRARVRRFRRWLAQTHAAAGYRVAASIRRSLQPTAMRRAAWPLRPRASRPHPPGAESV